MSTSTFRIAFTLKQHTPLIHFQHEQEGATLRATEVKTKLDQFIISGLNHSNPGSNNNNFFVGKTKSLNYKLRFKTDNRHYQNQKLQVKGPSLKNNKTVYETESFPLVLANMGGKEDPADLKNFTFFDELEGEIFSFDKGLLDLIQQNLEAFFVLNNFGNRQNKGFGSFTILNRRDPNSDYIGILNEQVSQFWYWEYSEKKDAHHIFTDISIIYSLLKTGINFPNHPLKPKLDHHGRQIIVNGRPKTELDESVRGPYAIYYKSFLYKYFSEHYKNYGNEKRFIKENFFMPGVRIQDDRKEKKYVRALLGTALFNEFRDKERKGKIIFKSREVERFNSPIVFKVIDNKVFFFINEITDAKIILNQHFNFAEVVNHEERTRSLYTPKNFDWYDLLNEFQTYYNSLIDSLDINLYEAYECGDNRLPVLVNNLIDVLSLIEINHINR